MIDPSAQKANRLRRPPGTRDFSRAGIAWHSRFASPSKRGHREGVLGTQGPRSSDTAYGKTSLLVLDRAGTDFLQGIFGAATPLILGLSQLVRCPYYTRQEFHQGPLL